MGTFIKKLLLGNVRFVKPDFDPIEKRVQNIKAIWNNTHQDDNGIEKIVRLFLATTQLLFPGLYVKHFAHKIAFKFVDLSVDFYVLIKVAFPLFILINGMQNNPYISGVVIYLLLETFLYIPTLIFASDLFSKPRSYKRSMLLFFFNYMEIIFAYAVLYSCDRYLNKPLKSWYDAVYFSVITSSSIGYGDYYPVTTEGKILVSTQTLLFLFFVVLFLNFFSSKIKTTGYFEQEGEK